MKVSGEEFERLVEEALATIPEYFKAHLENAELVIEDNPSREVLEEMGMGRHETLLGLYQGVPLDERGLWYGNVLPDKITLFRIPLQRMSRSLEELRDNIRKTVIHEVGHFFGMTDEELKRYE